MSSQNPDQNYDENQEAARGRAVDARELADERTEEVQQYLRDLYDRREVVTQTTTPSGQQLDWVPAESQIGGARLAYPPDEDRPPTYRDDRRAEAVSFELQRTGAERGPEGTVPLVRKPIEEIRPGVALQDWLAKGNRPKVLPPPDAPPSFEVPGGDQHKYAYSYLNVTCYGTEGNINAWATWVEWSNEFSLGQLWLTRGTGSGHQTLEVGHQVYRDLYGDWNPHLFIFYTTNNYTASGDNLGGYNQDVAGWVQYSNQVYPEAISSPVSVFDGQQYELQLKVQLWEGNWWVRVNGIWMGYYPSTLYNSGGLQSQADSVLWGGEVVDAGDHPERTQTDMGSGHWPEDGWQKCAYMNGLLYQSATDGTMSRYAATAVEPEPLCYGIIGHFNDPGSWGSHFWWGGSGRNSGCP